MTGGAPPGSTDDSASDKSRLRAIVRASRAAESPGDRERRGAGLLVHLPHVVRIAGPGLAGFQPTNDEPDIGPLLRAVPVPVYLPAVAAGNRLDWVLATAEDMTGHRTGIPVPSGPVVARGEAVSQLRIGAILVPALAVDPASGARLGYGAGYYDRLLPLLPTSVLAVGVCRDADLVRLPVQSHDAPVAAVLTESGLRMCGPAD